MEIHCAPGTSNPGGAVADRVVRPFATDDGTSDGSLSVPLALLQPTIATTATAANMRCEKLIQA
jgi:hypothetical protein